MFSGIIKFGETTSGGISSLGLNLKAFLFQLTTFVIVLLILRRFVFPKFVATLENRRKVLEQSLIQAREIEERLREAEVKAASLLHRSREQADVAMADAQKQAKEIIAKAENASQETADRLLKETENQINQEYANLHQQLKKELVELVAQTTEKVVRIKLDDKNDRALIEQQVKELVK